MLIIIASMERELSGVRRVLEPGPSHELRVVGIGTDRAGEALGRYFPRMWGPVTAGPS